MRSNNPALRPEIFQQPQKWNDVYGGGAVAGGAVAARPNTMTLQGAVNASFILLGLTMATSIVGWKLLSQQSAAAMPVVIVSVIGGLIVALVLSFRPKAAPFLAPVYALLEGVFVGAGSAMYAAQFGNQIVLQASILTFGIFLALLLAYTSRVIKATENFKLGVTAATGGIFFLFAASWVLSWFGIRIPYIWDAGPIGIAVAGFIVVIASLNLVLDFDFIEEGAKNGLPRYMEWYAAFGLLVTLIWLYFSVLRLLAQLQRSN